MISTIQLFNNILSFSTNFILTYIDQIYKTLDEKEKEIQDEIRLSVFVYGRREFLDQVKKICYTTSEIEFTEKDIWFIDYLNKFGGLYGEER